jgi:hypothetical protein
MGSDSVVEEERGERKKKKRERQKERKGGKEGLVVSCVPSEPACKTVISLLQKNR